MLSLSRDQLFAERYRIIEIIGHGGMAQVYSAYDRQTDGVVALKILHKLDAVSQERFQREGQILQSLNHPYCVNVISSGESEGSWYLVMALMKQTVADVLETRIPARGESLRWLEQIASALHYVHSRGYVHRDIKSSNILLDEHRDAYLGDFGIARTLTNTNPLTHTGFVVGSFHYMAPEMWHGATAKQSDIYALGIIFYELLSGQRPFQGENPAEIMNRHLNQVPAPIANLPAPLQQLLDKMLAKKMRQRYQSCEEILADLQHLQASPGEQTVMSVRLSQPPADHQDMAADNDDSDKQAVDADLGDIAHLQTASYAGKLLKVLSQDEESTIIPRLHALIELTSQGHANIEPMLIKLLQADSTPFLFQQYLITALANLGTARAVPVLQHVREEAPRSYLRLSAQVALEAIQKRLFP